MEWAGSEEKLCSFFGRVLQAAEFFFGLTAARKRLINMMAYSEEHTGRFWQMRLGTPDKVRSWHFYAYEYLDDLFFMPPARQVLGDWEHAAALIEQVENCFRQIGWEGDGEMQILWLPPFVGAGPEDWYGCYALHVKQDNDGISWMACPHRLPFRRLFPSLFRSKTIKKVKTKRRYPPDGNMSLLEEEAEGEIW
jgi:hypothetical protein